jgi:hypothetical protein
LYLPLRNGWHKFCFNLFILGVLSSVGPACAFTVTTSVCASTIWKDVRLHCIDAFFICAGGWDVVDAF